MPNDAKHHASVLACKDAQLGDSNVLTTGASERVGCGISLSFFTIITDPLRGSTSYLFLSPSCAQSLCDFRLHGVSHDAASPMPMASNFCVVGTCRIFLHRLAKVYAYSPKFALNHYCLTIFLAAKRHIKIVPNVTSKLCQMPHL